MPVSAALRRQIEDPRFWTGDGTPGGESGGDGDPRELRVSFPVTGGYALVLDLDAVTGERALGLRQPATGEPVPLGSAPADGPYPAALRWWELDLCARVIAWEDPTLPHPGLVVALLSPFAPATEFQPRRKTEAEPHTAGDEAVIAAIREAAYRSLRRDVPPPVPADPEQTPLPLFAGADWWPAPAGLSPRILDEAAIADLARPAVALLEVRSGSRFPHDGLADLVRKAAAHLDRVPRTSWYAQTCPLAREILDSGDLQRIPVLLAALTEVGCDHPTVLDALSDPLVPAEACWMVETLAGAEPGTLVRRHL